MPIDASSDPYDTAGLDPKDGFGIRPGERPDTDDDLDLDAAGTGASGKAAADAVADDEGPGDAKVGGDDDLDLDDAGSGAGVKDGLSLDLGADDPDGEGDLLGDLTDAKFQDLAADDDADDDLDLDGVGTGAKVDLGAETDELDDVDDDLDLDPGGKGDFGGLEDDGLDGDLKVGFGAEDVDADGDDPLGGSLDLDDDLDDPDDVKSLGDDLDDVF